MNRPHVRSRQARLRTMLAGLSAFVITASTLTLTSGAFADELDPSTIIDLPGDERPRIALLGAIENFDDNEYLAWCIDTRKPTPEGRAISIETLTDVRENNQGEFRVTTPQMAWILKNYEKLEDRATRSAISLLVRANYDVNGPDLVSRILQGTAQQAPDVIDRARELISLAKASNVTSYSSTSVDTANKRSGIINNIAALNEANTPVAGVEFHATLNGPAVFKATGTNTFIGTTTASPQSLEWQGTGNGTATLDLKFKAVRKTLTKYDHGGTVQESISYGNIGHADPEWAEVPDHTWNILFDFQPVAVSNVGESKIVTGDTISDTLTVSADPNQGAGTWLDNTPVTFKGTAYYHGEGLPTLGGVPSGAEVVAHAEVTATAPGDYTVTRPYTGKPGFITWVWEMKKANQQQPELISRDWSDQYGMETETSVKPFQAEVDTSIQALPTRNGTYLVDHVFINGLPSDHPNFEGGYGFKADTKNFDQKLYFFPESLAVTDENLSQAELIGSTTFPARNGFHNAVGSTVFKTKEGDPAGTYVFVTSLADGGRVKGMTTSVTDVHEQFTVEGPVPVIGTTATDKADGDKKIEPLSTATIVDKVCYNNLKPGKEYELTGRLMDKATGGPLLVDGKEVTATKTFTPDSAQGCEDIEFTFNATEQFDKTLVVFEDLHREGKLVAAHADINDEGQTITVGPKPETPQPEAPKPAESQGLAKTGANSALAGGAALMMAAGGAFALRRRYMMAA